jgi:hypothetical protein
MDLKQPESQASQEPPAPSELPRPTSTPASSTTEVLSPEELELIKQHRASTKKSRMDQGWDELLSALAARKLSSQNSILDCNRNYELHLRPEQLFLPSISPLRMLSTMILTKENSRRLTSQIRDHLQTFNQ